MLSVRVAATEAHQVGGMGSRLYILVKVVGGLAVEVERAERIGTVIGRQKRS